MYNLDIVLSSVYNAKAGFPLQPYRSEAQRISLFPDHQSGTNDFDTKENATVRYDTVEVENRLKGPDTADAIRQLT